MKLVVFAFLLLAMMIPEASAQYIGPYSQTLPSGQAPNQGQTYRGQLGGNPYDPNSINNPYGRYGNPYSPDSIRNPYGAGNPYSPTSPNNPYGRGMSIYSDD